MEVVTMQSEVFHALMKKLNSMEDEIIKIGNRKPRLEDEYLDSTEVCKLLQISRKTLERYRQKDMIPYIKLKKRVYYKFCDIEEFMQNNTSHKNFGIL
jgi:predicted DNA-binding transcriptional regulator AlpA